VYSICHGSVYDVEVHMLNPEFILESSLRFISTLLAGIVALEKKNTKKTKKVLLVYLLSKKVIVRHRKNR